MRLRLRLLVLEPSVFVIKKTSLWKQNGGYEVNALWNGHVWVITAVEIVVPFFAKLSLNNGEVVELQGSGELTQSMVSSQYHYTLVSAEIGGLCTSIGDWAFYECTGLTSITIPSSVTSIGDWAFYQCTGLTSIVVDSANTVYDSRNNCNAIIKTETNELITGCKNTIIPNTVTNIGTSAFDGCTSLTSIDIPDSVTSIGNSAFGGCMSLTSIDIPDSVTSIGDGAFSGCSGLTNVTIGGGVTIIGSNAFQSCSRLTSVTIPDSVTSIGSTAFYNCSKLTTITSLAAKAPAIVSDTFQNVKTGGTLRVPSDSTGYDTWMGTGNYYLGKYNWTKVEQ